MKTTRSYQFKIETTDGQVILQWVSATSQSEAFATAAIRQANLVPTAEIKAITYVG